MRLHVGLMAEPRSVGAVGERFAVAVAAVVAQGHLPHVLVRNCRRIPHGYRVLSASHEACHAECHAAWCRVVCVVAAVWSAAVDTFRPFT